MHSHNLRINPWKIYRNGRQFVEATMLPLHLEYSGWECQLGRRRETVGARGASQQNLISVWPSDSRYKGSFTYFIIWERVHLSKKAKAQRDNPIIKFYPLHYLQASPIVLKSELYDTQQPALKMLIFFQILLQLFVVSTLDMRPSQSQDGSQKPLINNNSWL